MNAHQNHQLSHAIVLATTRHDGQFDKGGAPYILHCLKVMHYVRAGSDYELMQIAVMHDLIEDTFAGDIDAGRKFLQSHGFSPRVVAGVVAMTKTPGITPEDYLAQVTANDDAVLVKMADLRHNTDIRRLKGTTPKDIERTAKYHHMYVALKDVALQRNLLRHL